MATQLVRRTIHVGSVKLRIVSKTTRHGTSFCIQRSLYGNSWRNVGRRGLSLPEACDAMNWHIADAQINSDRS